MSNSQDLFTKEDCLTVLSNYSPNQEVAYKSYTITKLESIEGLIGEHYRLKILYDDNGKTKEANLFLKMLNTGSQVMKEMSESIKAYEKEEFFYTYLLKEIRTYGFPTDFAPNCYLCRPHLFVLEDLSFKGYRNSPKKDMLDVRHCKLALKALAKFHSSTVLYENFKSGKDQGYANLLRTHPQELEDIFFSEIRNYAQQWLDCTFSGLLDLIDFLPESEISAEKFKSRLMEALVNSKKVEESPTKGVYTVLHGDLWSNNFLFEYENGVPKNSILIDYQVLKYGPMASDVVQMIFANVRRRLRDVHLEELLSYYYNKFSKYCMKHGVNAADLVSYTDFMECCDEVRIPTKLQCVADHSITFLMDEALQESLSNEENTREFLFGDRSKSMVLSFKENDLYREIMTEDLEELRDILFET